MQIKWYNGLAVMMALPFALLQSHVFWLVSALWTICTAPFSTEETPIALPAATTAVFSSPDPPHHQHITALLPSRSPSRAATYSTQTSRRRGVSEPPVATAQHLAKELRPRSATASSSQRRAGLFHRVPVDDLILRPTLYDERVGTTCPPQWWQKTLLYLDPRKFNSSLPTKSVLIDDKTVGTTEGTVDHHHHHQDEDEGEQKPDGNGQEPSKGDHHQHERPHKFWQRHSEAKRCRHGSTSPALHASNVPRRSLSLFRRKKSTGEPWQ